MNCQEAYTRLKTGETLLSGRQLFALRGKRILVTGQSFTTRLHPADFLTLYETNDFQPWETSEGIDMKKDEAYYQWRASHQ